MMTPRERAELAADIATRVRLYTWQPLPAQIAEHMAEYGWLQHFPINNSGLDPVVLEMSWSPRPARLELVFRAPNGERHGRFLWTPEAD